MRTAQTEGATVRRADSERITAPLRLLRTAVGAALVVLVFLLPLKFGTVVSPVAISVFPASFLEWILTPWPPFLAPMLGGLLLILAAVAWPPAPTNARAWWFMLPWLILPLASLPGLIQTTEWDFTSLFFAHLLGVAAIAACTIQVLKHQPAIRPWLLGAVVVAVLLASLSGWQQIVGGGYESTLEFAERQAAEHGTELPAGMRNRLTQGRAAGTFVYPNSFAAHLILAMPVAALLFWRWGRRFEPIRVSRALFMAAATVVFGGALLLTGSRAAIAAFGAGFMVACIWMPRLRRWRFPILLAGAVVAGGVFAAISYGRSLSSLEARFGYYHAGYEMFREHPLTGVGVGEFFPHYIRDKDPDAEETRLPHNMFILFAAQSGIAGAIAALGLLAIIIVLPWVAQRCFGSEVGGPFLFAVHWGLVSWILHALLDFNMLIPGTVMTAALLMAMAVSPEGIPHQPTVSRRHHGLQAALLLTGLLALAAVWRLPGAFHYRRLYAAVNRPGVSLNYLSKLARPARRYLPLSPYPDLLLAKAATARGQHKLAADAFRRAAQKAPHRAPFWRGLGDSLAALGDLEDAQDAYRKAAMWSSSDRRSLERDER